MSIQGRSGIIAGRDRKSGRSVGFDLVKPSFDGRKELALSRVILATV